MPIKAYVKRSTGGGGQRGVIGYRAMSKIRQFTCALLAVSALSGIAAPAASAGPVQDAVCYVKTGDAYRCFHWGP